MAFRVLTQDEVRRLLPIDDCVELMAEALGALARGELHNPLRLVIRPPGQGTLMGMMPAHRAQPAVYALKTVCIVPANPARGLDAPHQASLRERAQHVVHGLGRAITEAVAHGADDRVDARVRCARRYRREHRQA